MEIWSNMVYNMAGNTGMRINLGVGKIKCVSPSFIPPTFNTSSHTIPLGTYEEG